MLLTIRTLYDFFEDVYWAVSGLYFNPVGFTGESNELSSGYVVFIESNFALVLLILVGEDSGNVDVSNFIYLCELCK